MNRKQFIRNSGPIQKQTENFFISKVSFYMEMAGSGLQWAGLNVKGKSMPDQYRVAILSAL